MNYSYVISNHNNLLKQPLIITITLYDYLCKYFLIWYLPIVITFGFFGSIFCLLFLLYSKIFSSNLLIWLISICIGDFLILITEGIWMLLKIWYKIDIRDYNNWLCIIHTSLSNYLLYWSAYMQCILSIQRCYLVLYPLKIKSKWISLTKLFIYQIIISILLIIPILPYPLYWQIINNDCDPINEKIFRLTTLCDLIFWGLIPVFVMTTCTGIICRNLLARNKFTNKTIQSKMKMNQSNNHNHNNYYYCSSHSTRNISDLCKIHYPEDTEIHIHNEKKSCYSESLILNQENILTINNQTIRSMNDIRTTSELNKRKYITQDSHTHVTPLLLCMNFVYMASVCPLLIYFLYLNFIVDSIDNNMHKFLYYLFRSLCLLTTCTNWIFYCVAGKKFRDRTKQLLLSLCNSNKISSVINENGFLIIKYTDKHRCSVSNITRTKGLSSSDN
ncbi:unnamed protein product [Schistosoma curassoni]|uniref:G_PROTEIN_RECEP_F1_2 domain-containing protein n=1 Tax=Schistosoma curassoni TaxID=6186 RepID=A0A183KQD4_9TREM|nr:unnamed protein product [Schistosoma curassoni]VDP63204.1 unnamed protein product [Schistosoma curassoni]